jgi:hypothetical protein
MRLSGLKRGMIVGAKFDSARDVVSATVVVVVVMP